MLEVIKKLDSGTIRGLIVVTIPLLVLIASFFGLDEAVFQAELEGIGEKIVAFVSLAGVAWAAYTRIFQPTPPLTETAARLTEARLASEEIGRKKEGGYAHTALLLVLSSLLVLVASCGVLGIQSSGGFNDKLAGGYSTVTALYETISIRIDSKMRVAEMEPDEARRIEMVATIKADAQNLKDQVDKAKEGLDVTTSLKGVDFNSAEQRLASTLKILEALERYLEDKT